MLISIYSRGILKSYKSLLGQSLFTWLLIWRYEMYSSQTLGNYNEINKANSGAGKLALWSKALVALAVNLGLVLGAHAVAYNHM